MPSGRPAYQPTDKDRRMVETLTGMGATQDEIAGLIGVSDVTLRKYYDLELQQGVLKANMQVAQSLFDLATKQKNVAACIWWLKTRGGWKESATTIDMHQSYVVRAPAPVESAREW